MERTKLLKILNPILAVDFILLAGTILFRDAMSFKLYGQIHPVFGFILGGGIILHIILNWNWIKTSYFKKPAVK